jgi:hypothetical protein
MQMGVCTVLVDFHLGKYSTAEVIIVENTNTSPNDTENNKLNAAEVMNHGLLRIDAPAREYAASAQKTLTGIHEAGTSLSGSLESAVLHAIETNAKVNRNFADFVHKNTQASIGLFQTLSGVRTLQGAFQVYADYLKNMSETNLASYRGSAEYVRERVTEGATTARENLSKAFPRAA